MEVEFCEECVEGVERSELVVEAWAGCETSSFRFPDTCCGWEGGREGREGGREGEGEGGMEEGGREGEGG